MQVACLSDEQIHHLFERIRWGAGEPVCPHCGIEGAYRFVRTKTLKSGEVVQRPLFKCKACAKQYSVTKDSPFEDHKLPLRLIAVGLAYFIQGAKGLPALKLSHDLGVDYKTAFVLLHRFRDALSRLPKGLLTGDVETDVAFFGGYKKPTNEDGLREDRRRMRTGKRQGVLTVRERRRDGRVYAFLAQNESRGTAIVLKHVAKDGGLIFVDGAAGWTSLRKKRAVKVINHQRQFARWEDGIHIHTNKAESFFSRLRRGEAEHHKIAGTYLGAYADEMAWRETHRRKPDGEQFEMLFGTTLKQGLPQNYAWRGYWQRHRKNKEGTL